MESSKTMEYGVFGEDILVAILSLLPKKTLTRFKCVSKAWHSLLSDRSRVSPKTSHAGLLCQAMALEQPPLTTRALPSTPPPSDSHFLCHGMPPEPSSIASHYSMIFLRTYEDGSASDLPSHFFFMERHVSIVGTCNGLLLLTNIFLLKHPIGFVVHNPVTEHSTLVPLLAAARRNPIRLGFAYDGQCYHVIRISHEYGATALELDIFSSEAGEWREKHLPLPHSSRSYDAIAPFHKVPSLFFRGAVHWLLGGFILNFGLKDEKFKFVELPESGFYFDECIWEWEGSLSYCKANDNRIQIWIRRTDRRSEDEIRWELKHSAALTIPASIGTSACMFEPCAFNDDFEIVHLKCNRRLFSYRLENGALKEVHYKECSHRENLSAVVPFWNGPMNWIECETVRAVFPFWNGPVNSI
ncbi:hypothetical protein ACLOJK_040963 [Asimina triloba]